MLTDRNPIFVVMHMDTDVQLSNLGGIHTIPLVYAEGMVGALPCFATRESAEIFAGNVCDVVEAVVTQDK